MLLAAKSGGGFQWSTFCGAESGVSNILQVVGYGILIIRVAIPIIIIVLGMLHGEFLKIK